MDIKTGDLVMIIKSSLYYGNYVGSIGKVHHCWKYYIFVDLYVKKVLTNLVFSFDQVVKIKEAGTDEIQNN